jgi:hypothetical protein
MDRNEFSFDPRHLGGPSDVAKKISVPMVHSAQIVYLFCTEINIVSKRIETSFHLTHAT